MSKEVAKREAELPAVPAEAWGTENVDSADILIPKILLQQGLSKRVADEKNKMGDIINSVTGELLGDKKKAVELIPITTFKTWIISEKPKGKDKFDFKTVVPFTPQNSMWEQEEHLGDVDIRRDRCLNFMVLLASDAAKPDALPYLLSFRRTGYKTGQKLATHFARSRELKQPPAAKVFNLKCNFVENDKGKFYVFDLDEARASKNEELTKAYQWYRTLQSSQKVRVDDSDLVEESLPTDSSTVTSETRF